MDEGGGRFLVSSSVVDVFLRSILAVRSSWFVQGGDIKVTFCEQPPGGSPSQRQCRVEIKGLFCGVFLVLGNFPDGIEVGCCWY